MSVSDQPSTRSGRDPQEAEQQIATQGDEIDKEALRELLAEEASRPVPAGSPAKWRERAESLLDDIGSCFDDAGPSHEVYLLKAHLAAMPQPEPNAELLGALRKAHGLTEDLYHALRCDTCDLIRQAEKGAAS